jgi:hypothetical protein
VDVQVTTVSQLVNELSRFTDAEQSLIVAFVALMVVVFTCWVGFAVVLVTRTVLSVGWRLAAWRPAGGSQSDERGSLGVPGRAAIAGKRSAVGLE